MTAHWGITTTAAPALTGDADATIVAWVDESQRVNTGWVNSLDASRSPVAAPTQETAVGRPGVVGTHIAWSGTDGEATINVAVCTTQVRYDPVVYQQKVTLWGMHAPAGPAIGWGNNRLYLSWADEQGALHLGWSATPMDQNSWQSTQLAESAIDAPSLSAGYGDTVWLSWAGTDGNGTLNVASGFRPGSESSYNKTILDGNAGAFFQQQMPPAFHGPDFSPSGPELEVDDLSFTMAYAGTDQHIYLLIAFAGSFNRYKCNDTSDVGVAVSGRASGGGFAWRGLDGGFTLNTAFNEFNEMGAVEAN